MYIYETHLHTIQGSACGRVSAPDYVEYMKEKGYSGIFVTDHFFNGNSCIPKDLSWKERIDRYQAGYRTAKAVEREDFRVFFGLEYNFQGDEYLIYGVDGTWLTAHPEIMDLGRKAVHDLVREAGGMMIQAHPFREAPYLRAVRLCPDACDGVEVYNAANKGFMNAQAREYAASIGVPFSAGSDIHFFGDEPLGGVAFDTPLKSEQDYVDRFLKGEGVPYGRSPEGLWRPVSEIPEQCTITRRTEYPIVHYEA